jgi:hypothetical protein
MTREEVRKEYASLMKEWVEAKGEVSAQLSSKFQQLKQLCSHPFGRLNYEIGCWACPDCGKQEHAEMFHQHTK